jgi:hypothetical protein
MSHWHHERPFKAYGKASLYLCVDCDKRAQDWSRIHGTTGEDADDYDPRCKKCHHSYDKAIHDAATARGYETRWTPEARAKASADMAAIRDKLTKAQWTPEKREAKRQETIARNQLPVSDETRRRMSEAHKGVPRSTARRDDYLRRKREREGDA